MFPKKSWKDLFAEILASTFFSSSWGCQSKFLFTIFAREKNKKLKVKKIKTFRELAVLAWPFQSPRDRVTGHAGYHLRERIIRNKDYCSGVTKHTIFVEKIQFYSLNRNIQWKSESTFLCSNVFRVFLGANWCTHGTHKGVSVVGVRGGGGVGRQGILSPDGWFL